MWCDRSTGTVLTFIVLAGCVHSVTVSAVLSNVCFSGGLQPNGRCCRYFMVPIEENVDEISFEYVPSAVPLLGAALRPVNSWHATDPDADSQCLAPDSADRINHAGSPVTPEPTGSPDQP